MSGSLELSSLSKFALVFGIYQNFDMYMSYEHHGFKLGKCSRCKTFPVDIWRLRSLASENNDVWATYCYF